MTFAPVTHSVLLILNPTAGRRRRGLVDEVVRRVRAAGWTVDVVETRAAGDARRLAETCDAARYGVVAVAGGDGTINEVVNGLAARPRPRRRSRWCRSAPPTCWHMNSGWTPPRRRWLES